MTKKQDQTLNEASKNEAAVQDDVTATTQSDIELFIQRGNALYKNQAEKLTAMRERFEVEVMRTNQIYDRQIDAIRTERENTLHSMTAAFEKAYEEQKRMLDAVSHLRRA